MMNRTPLSIPEIAIIGGTRAALGAGAGLLVANYLNEDQRRAAGWVLLGVGSISTIPIAIQLIRSLRQEESDRRWRGSHRLAEREHA